MTTHNKLFLRVVVILWAIQYLNTYRLVFIVIIVFDSNLTISQLTFLEDTLNSKWN